MTNSLLLKIAIEIVNLPSKNGDFHIVMLVYHEGNNDTVDDCEILHQLGWLKAYGMFTIHRLVIWISQPSTVPSGKQTSSYWTWPVYHWFTH